MLCSWHKVASLAALVNSPLAASACKCRSCLEPGTNAVCTNGVISMGSEVKLQQWHADRQCPYWQTGDVDIAVA